MLLLTYRSYFGLCNDTDAQITFQVLICVRYCVTAVDYFSCLFRVFSCL